MISSYFQGGLGNQMFQIATAASLAFENNDKIIFNPAYHDLPLQGRKTKAYRDNIFKNIPFSDTYKIKNMFREKSFNYSKIPYQENLALIGYFQSEKYFLKNQQKIRNLFQIDKQSENYINEKYGKILSKKPISVHIRRGDYLNNPTHPTKHAQYYNKSIDMFPKDSSFLFFSDDIGWCKDNFQKENFFFSSDNPDYIDMFLMSKCSHNIIANSSFSWWAAWLNNNTEKFVISPKKWFGPTVEHNTEDLIPKGWLRI